MNWTNGEQEYILVAKAQVAPLDEVAELVERYQKSMLDARSVGGFLSPAGSSANFEKAVLSRNDNYLNLLLSKCVSNWDVSRALWEIAKNKPEHTDDYRSAIRNSILSGNSVWSILKERRGSAQTVEEGKISIVELINNDNWEEDIDAILTNPNIKPALGEILLRQNSFAEINEDRITDILNLIARNPALNEDKTDREGPDHDHWALQNALFTLIENAPVTKPWFFALEKIIDAIEPEAFNSSLFPSKEFVARWLEFKLVSNSGDDESDTRKEEPDGFYTNLKLVDEFLSIFAAKFGFEFIVDMGVDVQKALTLPNAYDRAAFFGKKDLNYNEVVELLERKFLINKGIYNTGITERFWLIFNLSVMLNPKSRKRVQKRLPYYQSLFFDSRVEFLKKKYPDSFKADQLFIKKKKFKKDIGSINQTVIELKSSATHLEQNLSSVTQGLKAIFYIVIFILVIEIFIAVFK